MISIKHIVYLSLVAGLFFSCQEEQDIDLDPGVYTAAEFSVISNQLNLPESPFAYGFGNSEIGIMTDHKATLGRVLFYDTKLSSDGKVACASCHQQSLAFADDEPFSIGPDGKLTERNSISLGSLRSFGAHYKIIENTDKSNALFWDERAGTIKEQLEQTINNPAEMNMDVKDIADLVQETDYYNILHRKAFQSETVTEDNVLESIEAFINSISSTSTNLEQNILGQLNFINGDYVTGASGYELGLNLFKDHCNSCHTTSLHHFLDVEESKRITSANNGLDLKSSDLGRYMVTQKEEDKGIFKIPGLHNIALTGPYMHDGRFATLEEVVDHYSEGITNNANLHPLLQKGDEALRLNLSDEEKNALVEFLGLLTDEELTTEEKWSNPFL